MVLLINQRLCSDCVAVVEQMLSSSCCAANRPLGTHNPSSCSLATVFVLPASHCISPWLSTVFVCIATAFPVAPLTFVSAEDWLSLCPYDCTVWENNDFFVFWIVADWSGFGKSAEEREEEANWWPTHLQTLVSEQSWRHWQGNSGNSNRNFMDRLCY